MAPLLTGMSQRELHNALRLRRSPAVPAVATTRQHRGPCGERHARLHGSPDRAEKHPKLPLLATSRSPCLSAQRHLAGVALRKVLWPEEWVSAADRGFIVKPVPGTAGIIT
jgi:hypothetical protein